MHSSNAIKIRFAYTFSDWALAALFYASRTWGFGLRTLVVFIALGLAGYFSWLSYHLWPVHGLDDNFWYALVFFWFAIEMKFGFLQLLRMWLQFRRNANKPPGVCEFSFDETGARYFIRNVSVNLDVEQTWAQFKNVLENKHLFLLIRKERGYWSIPKRDFADDDQINALRDLLRRKVGKEAELPPAMH